MTYFSGNELQWTADSTSWFTEKPIHLDAINTDIIVPPTEGQKHNRGLAWWLILIWIVSGLYKMINSFNNNKWHYPLQLDTITVSIRHLWKDRLCDC